ncbi:MAG TPA: hypothetical protein V6D29_23120, partial [Leptolyngbyaceae cyanobacterium]
FLLKDSYGQNIARCPLPKSPVVAEADIEVSEPPRKLLNWLSHASEAEFKATIALRHQILGFDGRMKEIIEPQRIVYGKGKSKLCCELRKMGQLGFLGTEVAKFLWLPHPHKTQVLRMMVGTDKNGKNATGLLHYPIASRPKDLWQFPSLARWPGSSGVTLKSYKLLLDSEMNCPLPKLIGLALKSWQARL